MTTAPARPPVVVAWGGAAAEAPEHTIPAYEAAVAAGADALGLDVRLSADGQLVVLRDARLERTTDGHGPVAARTLRELRRLDAGRWRGRRFRGQRIQTLAEVLERFRDRAGFVVELAGGSEFQPGIEERLVDLLRLVGLIDRTLVISRDLPALQDCRAIEPDLRLAARPGCRPLRPEALAPPGLLSALILPADLMTAQDLTACRAVGLDVYADPVDDREAATRLSGWGVAGLITAYPERLRPGPRGSGHAAATTAASDRSASPG
jgi:glycerophosphoryl diester phosphodiesterase